MFLFFSDLSYNKTMKTETEENKRIRVIIDSDVANEIDDQFAISYALARPDKLKVEAITLAPFRVSWQKNLTIRDGMIDSKNEADRLLRLFGFKYSSENPFVYFGSTGFVSEGFNESSPAVEKIIELAKENEPLYICCLGTLTNVAMALRIAPKIASKIKVVWLGTDNILLDKFQDANYRKDILAFEEVAKSKVDFTIFPTFLARSFVTSVYEFERNIQENSVTRYLSSIIKRFRFTEENLGLKVIYDIGPISFLINREKFGEKMVPARLLLKNDQQKCSNSRKVNCVTSVPKNFFVWSDFLESVNKIEGAGFKSRVFFVSDTHFGEESKVRRKLVPFKSVEEMDKELVKRWNNKVGANDIVYHLGDFGNYDVINQLNGRITLICGNYEKAEFRKDFKNFRKKLLQLGFVDVIRDGMYLDESVLGEKVYLTHKPSDHAADCKTIFGHVHTLSLVKEFGFNVCVTYHYFAPVSAETAKRYLKFLNTSADEDVFIG